MPLETFGIFSASLAGIMSDMPNITMPEAFLTDDSENTRLRWGEIQRAKGRNNVMAPIVENWATGTTYAVGDWVTYGAGSTKTLSVWEAKTNEAANIPPVAWDSTDTYAANDYVIYSGVTWKSLQSSNTDHTPAEDSWWTEEDSAKWSAGIGGTGNPGWDTGTTYKDGERELYGGIIYVSMKGSNLNKQPDTQTAWWDAEYIIRTHRHIDSNLDVYQFAFTQSVIWKWNGTTWGEWLVAATAWGVVDGTDHTFANTGGGYLPYATHWDTVSFNDKVIVTNNVSVVGVMDGAATATFLLHASGIDVSGTPTYLSRAKYLQKFENHLVALNVTVTGGGPNELYWCVIGDHTDWKGDGSGSITAGSKGQDGGITGSGLYRDFMIVFKDHSIHRFWLTTTSAIFGQAAMNNDIGCKVDGSIVNGPLGDLFFFASDNTFREIQKGMISSPQGSFGVDKIVKDIHEDNVHLIRGHLMQEHGEILWAIPKGNSEDVTANNKVLVYRPEEAKWSGILDMDIASFGVYHLEADTAATWDTIDATLYPTWDDWNPEGGWDGIDTFSGRIFNISTDFNDNVHLLYSSGNDKGASYNGTFVLSTDLSHPQMSAWFKKRVSMLRLFFRNSVNVMTIQYKRDNETGWQTPTASHPSGGTAGTLSAIATDKEIYELSLPVDFLAKHIQIQVVSADDFFFVGMIFEFTVTGER